MFPTIPDVQLNNRPISAEDTADTRNISNESSRCEETFRPSFILKVFCLHWLASVGLFIAGLYLTLQPLTDCTGYYLIVYLQLGFWIGTYAINDVIKPKCRKMLSQDYRLYRRLSTYRKRPLQIVSIWNTILIATQQYVSSHMDKEKSSSSEADCGAAWSAPQAFIVAFNGLQMLALCMFYVPAIVKLIEIVRRKESRTECETRFARSVNEVNEVLTIKEKLMQHAEEIKEIKREKHRLRKAAKKLGITDVQ